MILYFSGGTTSKLITEFMQEHNCSRLLSYYNDKKVIEQKLCDDVFLDCGAWSAFNRKVVIDIGTYLDYIKSHRDYFTVAASLDVIPTNNVNKSAEDSFDNYICLKKHIGNEFPLVPTYHKGEPLDYLKKLLCYPDVDYIGIGGMLGYKDTAKNRRELFLDLVFDIIQKEHPDIKVHLFGLTDLSLLGKYPIYSADSTTWSRAASYGEILTDFGRILISDKSYYTGSVSRFMSVNNFNEEQLFKMKGYVNNYGFTIEELQSSVEKRQMFNIVYMKKKADNLTTTSSIYVPRKRLF